MVNISDSITLILGLLVLLTLRCVVLSRRRLGEGTSPRLEALLKDPGFAQQYWGHQMFGRAVSEAAPIDSGSDSKILTGVAPKDFRTLRSEQAHTRPPLYNLL